MKKIGLLSDTHGYMDPRIPELFSGCHEIWHAGDVGAASVLEALEAITKVRAVYGNIDDRELRSICPLHQRFTCESLKVWITHIGGYPGHYPSEIRKSLTENPPGLFISGHSHILKVMYDQQFSLLHINPGAAGKAGFHQKRTVVRFEIHDDEIRELEVIELGMR